MESERSLTGKDVVSKLFQNEPAPKDYLGELYDLHRQAFQTSSHKELQIPPSDSSSSKSNTVIEDADMLLNVFRNRLEWEKFRAESRAKIATYLKSLSQMMDSISTSNSGGHPDIFAMFKSVLDLLVPKYAPHETGTRCSSPSQDTGSVLSATEQDNMDAELPCTGSSSCPILNGSIKGTDFWRASEAARCFDGSTDSCDLGDGLFNGSQDWLNVFSQWVVDLNDADDYA
ncbi:hypothetical protein PENSUB_11318 [Penicillium subrubescens]|uniref:Uncharacterized protein n=1 Tax=Penicillium subrubescens TaxID=1316194 RepID=A0A1Q5T4B5_9EURO|nr:hypothetical protein PENSUB_11318 [Penicillium subrubescens]